MEKEEGKKNISFDEKGNIIFKETQNIKRGKKSKAAGGQFELRVRRDLEEKGWIVDKWSNNLDLDINKIIPAKRRMGFVNRNMRIMTVGTGFPDFIAFQRLEENSYKVIGVEVKMNGKLSKLEKEKCSWYLNNKTFSEVWVAKKVKEKNRVSVVYDSFEEKFK
jgi:hypothetical protein